MEFELYLEDNLFRLREELLSGCYHHGAYRSFTVFDPKKRSIHKAAVRDRVVHQAIVNIIEPLFERRFIHDSYSCRVGKGTHAAVRRLRQFLLRASRNDTRTVYVLKCDIRKFVASVDHRILGSLLRKCVIDERDIGLIEEIIGSFATTPGKGLPLGNLTSQLFANVYLHELDWFVKYGIRTKHYLRYCDDFIIVDDSCRNLEKLVGLVSDFLHHRLELELHPNKILIRSWLQGIDFLGYVTLPHCTVLCIKTARRIVHRASPTNLSSYFGLCKHAAAFDLKRLLLNRTASAIRVDLTEE